MSRCHKLIYWVCLFLFFVLIAVGIFDYFTLFPEMTYPKYLILKPAINRIGIYSLFFTVLCIFIAWSIAEGQNKQMNGLSRLTKMIQDRIWGELTDFDEVYENTKRLLQEVEKNEDSKVWAMIYWLWFGVDDVIKSKDDWLKVNMYSDIGKLLETRRVNKLETNIVTYDVESDSGVLLEFIKSLLNHWKTKYGISSMDENLPVTVLEQYKLFYRDLINREHERFFVHTERDIPMLIFVIETKKGGAGILFLGEKPIISIPGTKIGGFLTRDPQMVDVLRSQIASQIGRRQNNEHRSPALHMANQAEIVGESVVP